MLVQSQSNHPFHSLALASVGLDCQRRLHLSPKTPCATNVTNSDWVCQVCAVVSLGTGRFWCVFGSGLVSRSSARSFR
jgi:hypothetical protein